MPQEISNLLNKYKRIYVLFSGGKDSLAALLLIYENVPHDKIVVVFNEVTGNTAKENIEFVYKVCEELNLKLIHYKHNTSFWYYVDKYYLPGPNKRWCYRIFKKEYWDNLTGLVITGIKKHDSKFRENKYNKIFYNGRQIVYNPIWDLHDDEVWGIIKQYGFKIPTYEKYGCNANCVFCPFYDIYSIMEISNTEWREFLLQKLKEVYNKTQSKFEKNVLSKWLRYLNNKKLI